MSAWNLFSADLRQLSTFQARCRNYVSDKLGLHSLFRSRSTRLYATRLVGLRRHSIICTASSPTHRQSRHFSVSSCWKSLQSDLGPESSAVGYNDYERERREFRLVQPEFYNFASDVIDRWAHIEQTTDIRRNVPAFWWVNELGGEVQWTFQDLADKSRRVANMLVGPCQLKPGDRVLAILPKLPQWWLLNIACIRAGVVLIPGTTQLTSKDIKLRIQRSGAKCIIADMPTAEKVDEVIDDCPTIMTKVVVEGLRLSWYLFEDMFIHCGNDFQTFQTRSNDLMTIFFTSGTTGEPKMAAHTHASYGLGHLITARHWLDLTPTDIHWNFSDPGWAKTAWSNVYSPWINGACVFIHAMPKFDPEYVLQVLERYPVTTLCCPPTGFRMLVKANLGHYNIKHLRHCVAGGEPLKTEVVERWLDGTGRLIREGYGQTETVAVCCTPRCLPVKLGSMGKPTPGMDIAIVNTEGQEVGPNVEGEIAVCLSPQRPVGLFSGYINNPEKTAAVMQGDFYLTGDFARRDDEGYIWFSSRSDDVIISAGYRIGPFEVESALLEHPAVAEAAVVSSPDETRGEIVKAFVVLSPDFNDYDRQTLVGELQKHVQTVTAPYKYPRKIEFIDSLPKTVSGKIRRVELRNKEWNR